VFWPLPVAEPSP
jgi:hypothetical protein